MKKQLTYVVIVFFLLFTSCSKNKKNIKRPNVVVETVFGKYEISEPIVLEFLDSKIMQRLKKIDQSGTSKYFFDLPDFSRYSHSVGVYVLLSKIHASLEERVAGLLHDASHTVFSHVGDFVFQRNYKDTYQDKIHQWYLEKVNAGEILEKYNLSLLDVLPENEKFFALEQSLPDMCADRIEYNLHTGLLFKLITQDEIDKVVEDLKFEDNKWFFTESQLAKKFASLSIYFTEKFWGSDWNFVVYSWSASIIERAFDLNLVTINDIHFGTDSEVLKKLYNSKDPYIMDLLKKCSEPCRYYEKASYKNNAVVYCPKFRGIDPLVKIDSKFYRLTELDEDYNLEYQRVSDKIKSGIPITFKTEDDNDNNDKLIAEYKIFLNR